MEAIGAFVEGTSPEVPTSVLDAVRTEQVSLLDIVRELGPALTSEADARRTRAVALLSGVVVHLAEAPAPRALPRQAIRTLTAFFCEKLADASAIAAEAVRAHNDGTLVPASAPLGARQAADQRTLAHSQMLVDCLDVLLALSGVGFERERAVHREHFGGSDACAVSAALFASLELRSHPQPLRHTAVRLLDSLVARHRAALLTMRRAPDAPAGSGFVEGYTALVSGEKDPRNLLVLFRIARVLLIEWEMDAGMADAFFNVLFCYFPITFRAPPDDPYQITPEMLKDALRACLCASPAFAPQAMPLFLEKLGASGGSAKVDVLRTLDAALPVYGRAAAVANADALWGHLKLDILQPTDDDSAACAQTTLTTLLRVVHGDEETRDGPPAGAAATVLSEVAALLDEPGKALAKTSVQLVHALVAAAPATAVPTVHAVLAQLLRRLGEHGEEEDALLTLLAAVLDVVQRVCAPGDAAAAPAAPARTHDAEARALDAHRDALTAALLRGLEAGRRPAALHGLVVLTQVPGVLRADEVAYAVRALQPLLLEDGAEGAAALRDAALAGLERIRRAHLRAIEEQTLPYLLAQLPPTLPDAPDLARVRRALGALARLGTAPALFDALVVRVCALLDTACADAPADAVRVGYAAALLATLQVALEAKRAARHTDIPKYAAALPPRLVPLLRTDDAACVGAHAAVAQHVAELVALLVPALDAPKQAALLHACAPHVAVPAPDAPAPAAHRLAVLAALVAGAARDAPLPYDAAACARAAHAFLVDRAVRAEDALAAHAACVLLCALANKWLAPDALPALVDAGWAPLAPRATHTHSLAQRVRALDAWVWLARGLLARGDAHGAAMVERVRAELLPDAALGVPAARALRVLASDDALVTRANGFQVRMLYRQRLLDQLLPQLVDGYRGAAGGAQATYLVALATLLPALPAASLGARVVELLPLLVHTLGIADAHARASAASALHAALRELPERAVDPPPPSALEAALVDALATLVPRLLAQVTPGPHTPAPTRTAALQVLGALVPRLAHDALVPYRRDVVHALGAPRQGVDDARRAVRVHAVDCRDAWYRISTLE